MALGEAAISFDIKKRREFPEPIERDIKKTEPPELVQCTPFIGQRLYRNNGLSSEFHWTQSL